MPSRSGTMATAGCRYTAPSSLSAFHTATRYREGLAGML